MLKTREEWLKHLAQLLASVFSKSGYQIPANVRFSCGWSGGGSRATRIGECWHSKASADGHFEVFISPALSDPIRVAGVLVHELVHTVVGIEAGHGPAFRACALSVGLEGPMRATTPSEALSGILAHLTAQIGPYPHATLSASDRPTKKDTTRLLKVACPECGYTVRVTAKWLLVGFPVCPCGATMEQAD
jgi:hypothetical protein